MAKIFSKSSPMSNDLTQIYTVLFNCPSQINPNLAPKVRHPNLKPQREPLITVCAEQTSAVCAAGYSAKQNVTSVTRKTVLYSVTEFLYLEKSNSATLSTLSCVGQLSKESLIQGERSVAFQLFQVSLHNKSIEERCIAHPHRTSSIVTCEKAALGENGTMPCSRGAV